MVFSRGKSPSKDSKEQGLPPAPTKAPQYRAGSASDPHAPSSLLLNELTGGLPLPLDDQESGAAQPFGPDDSRKKETTPAGPGGEGVLDALALEGAEGSPPPQRHEGRQTQPSRFARPPFEPGPPVEEGLEPIDLLPMEQAEAEDEVTSQEEVDSSLPTDEPAVLPWAAKIKDTTPKAALRTEAPEKTAPPDTDGPHREDTKTVRDEDPSALLLDDILAVESQPPSGTAPAKPPTTEPVFADFAADRRPSSLLIEDEKPPLPGAARSQPAAPSTQGPPSGWGGLAEGKSSLLIDGKPASGTAAPEAPAKRRRLRRRRSERVRVVLPAAGEPIQWYSNPEACSIYCRKHRRPLLLYFTTGDVDQCRTYEEAIRMAEMVPFLCQYVCCLVNLSQAEGQQTARRFGVPPNGPSVVLLAPSGAELARVVKSEVDWQFVATMLFWVLQ